MNQIQTTEQQTASWWEYIKSSKDHVGLLLIGAGLGFLLGFICKKLSSLIFIIILIIVALLALQQFEYIHVSVDWVKIQTFFGMQPTPFDQSSSFMSSVWQWVKDHILFSISFGIGFLFGLRLG